LAVDALPWTPLFAVGVVWWSRRGRWRTDADARLGLVWLAAMTALLSCARFKRGDYLAPAYPGLAIFLGCTAERWWLAASPRRRARAAGALAVVVAGCLVGWGVYLDFTLPRQEAGRDLRPLAARIRTVCPPPQVVLFFRAEAHPLAFHLGRPLNTFREWENLDVWAGRPGPHYILMPAEAARDWPAHVTAGRLDEVLRQTVPGSDHDRTFVLMRTGPRE
jgi:hypothetical protein